MSLVMNKCFMSQNTALKLQYNKETNSVYLHAGKKQDNDEWDWIKAKFNDSELARIKCVLDGKLDNVSFFHKFDDKDKKIWVNRKNDTIFVRIEDITKPLDQGEAEVFKLLLDKAIVCVNYCS